MTPPATAAARKPAPRHPRRVSGPARGLGVARAGAAAPGIALPRPRPARRYSPPARRHGAGEPGIALGVRAAWVRLSRSALLAWLTARRARAARGEAVVGRIWIAMVAFALIGIVAMQLWVLKLNAGIGHAIEHEAQLQRENAALSIENSEASAGDRVESQASSQMNMVYVAPGGLHFLAVHGGSIDARRAAATLSKRIQAGQPTGLSAGSAAPAGSAAATGAGPATGAAPQG
jgi:cell division protein FtsL